MDFTQFLYYGILTTGLVAGLAQATRLSGPSRWLLALVSFVLLKEITAYLLAIKYRQNLGFYQYLGAVDFVLAALVIISIPLMKAMSRQLIMLTIAVLIFYVLNIILWQPPGLGADTNFKMVRSFVLVYFVLLLMYRLHQHPDQESIFRKSSFWLAAGLLFFYCFSIFYWGAYNYFLRKDQAGQAQLLRPLFVFVNYLLYGFLAIALWLNNFQQKEYAER